MRNLVLFVKNALHDFKTENPQELCEGFDVRIKKAYVSFLAGSDSQVVELFKEYMFWLLVKGIVSKEDLYSLTTNEERLRLNVFIDYPEIEKKHELVTLIDSDMKATGNCLVYAFGKSRVNAFDTSTVNIYDESYGCITDCMGNAFGKSTLICKGYSYGMYFDKSNGNASGRSMVILADECNVSNTTQVYLIDNR